MFALSQPLPLAEIRAGVDAHHLPMADAKTPDWYGAAATSGSSLAAMAPELQVLPSDPEQAQSVDVSGIDLVRIYAEVEALEAEPDQAPPSPPTTSRPDPSIRLDLIKELSELDE